MTTDTAFAFSAGPDERALRAAFKHFLRPTFAFIRGGGIALAVLGVLFLVLGQYLVALFVLLLAVGFVAVVPARSLQRVMTKVGAMAALGASYRVDERGIFAANELVEALYRWPALTKVDELPGMLLVSMGQSGFVGMRTGELDPQTRAALTEFVRARVGRG